MYTSAEVCELAGVTYRQVQHWNSLGYVHGTFVDRATNKPVVLADSRYAGTGKVLLFDPAEASMVKALGVLSNLSFGSGGRCTRSLTEAVIEALRSVPVERWPGRSLVVNSQGVAVDGPVGTAALVVDLGSCVVGDAGLAAVV